MTRRKSRRGPRFSSVDLDESRAFVRDDLTVRNFQELGDIRSSTFKGFRDVQVDDCNILTWQGLIVPVSYF